MKCEHAERQPGHHLQLNLGAVGEDVRTKRERDRRDDCGAAVARQVPHQEVHPDRAQHEAAQDRDVQRGVRIARQPVRRKREDARAEIGFRVRERAPVRIENVGVEHVHRIDDERPRDPRHVPHRELAVAVVDPRHVTQLERERVRHRDRQHDGAGRDERELAPGRHRAAATAVKRIRTPRLRKSFEAGSCRRGVNPSVERADSRYA